MSYEKTDLLRLLSGSRRSGINSNVDVWGHVVIAPACCRLASQAVCMHVCTYTLVYFSRAMRGPWQGAQKKMGPMAGEIMTLANRILGDGGESCCEKK